jgi:RHS repeat-associated protein
MKTSNHLTLSASPSTLPARKPCLTPRSLYRRTRPRLTGKEQDSETGLYYYGARYLDPKAGRWLSGDPALGEYVPRRGRGPDKLSGMGGVYNTVNFHAYHYAGNNPVKLTDPNGRNSIWEIDEENQKREIKIPVKFSDGTTIEQKEAFSKAAKGWEGTYRLPSGFGHHGGRGRRRENDYIISFTVIETQEDMYEGMGVNTVTFSPESYSEEEGRFSNVQGNKDMTIYENSGGSPDGLVNLLKHEIAHLLGIEDKYTTEYKDGVRTGTPARPGWENNIAAEINGQVDSRNFLEANNRIYVNRKVFRY